MNLPLLYQALEQFDQMVSNSSLTRAQHGQLMVAVRELRNKIALAVRDSVPPLSGITASDEEEGIMQVPDGPPQTHL